MKMIILALFATISCVTHGFGNARLTVKVIDSESGNPLPGIRVHGGFLNYPRGWGIAAKDNNDEGITDRDGICRLSGNTEAGESCCIVRRNEGYYNSGWYSFDYKERSVLKLGRWLPDDVVVIVRLDRVIKPIPLYVKYAHGEYRQKSRAYHEVYARERDLSATNDIPIIKNEMMAFDIVKGEWLPPRGNGEVADIQFTFNETVMGWKEGRGYDGRYVSKKYKTTMSISMPGEGNGIVEVPVNTGAGIQVREAPLDGYSSNVSRWIGWFGGGDGTKTDCDKTRCYVFRIRTKYDDEGKIRIAYYGKIYGDFNIQDVDGVEFLYYLNPEPNDRNLEWDMKHNLCPKPGDIGNPQP